MAETEKPKGVGVTGITNISQVWEVVSFEKVYETL